MEDAKSAASVGCGIPKVKTRKVQKIKVSSETTPLSAAKDAGDWADEPDVAGQLFDPKLHRMGKQEVVVLDLAKAEDLLKYNMLLTRSATPKANIIILVEEKQFDEKTGGWKVFLKLQHVEFRKLFKKGHKPDNVEMQETYQQSL